MDGNLNITQGDLRHMNRSTTITNGDAFNIESRVTEQQLPLTTSLIVAPNAVVSPDPSAAYHEHDRTSDVRRSRPVEMTTADECRLIFNMFMSRSSVTEGSSVSEETDKISPSPSLIKNAPAPLVHSRSSHGEALIERILIEFFLTGTALPDTIFLGFLTEQNHPDVAAVELPGTTETQDNTKPSSDSPSP